MKILQVIDRLEVGGAERVAVDLSLLLSEEKSDTVDFMCLLDSAVLDEELIKNQLTVIYLKRLQKFNPFILYKALKIFNTYDIVHVHSRHVLRYVGLTFLPFFKRKFKLVFHDHYGAIGTDTSISWYLKYCIKKSSAYIGVSSSLIDWAIKHELSKDIYLLSNIVRNTSVNKTNPTISSVVVVGNFRPQKNYEFLCHLIKKLPESISVDLYGNIVDEDYYAKILALRTGLKIENRLHIITGEKSISSLLCNYKLALHCAASETGPLVAIEYLSKGLPVVMFRTGEVVEIISKISNKTIMSDFELHNWSDMIENLLANETERIQLENLMSKIFKENYSEENYKKACQNIYQNIINS